MDANPRNCWRTTSRWTTAHPSGGPAWLTVGQVESGAIYLFGGGVAAPQQIALFHGTSWENAQRIERDGFDLKFAHHGQLGKGVYVARHEKACRFAENGAWHDGDEGGLIKVLVNIQNPKYVSEVQRAGHWWDEGYDACRVDSTPLSSNMEWCIRDPHVIDVIEIEAVYI